jgi:hypothetical protein
MHADYKAGIEFAFAERHYNPYSELQLMIPFAGNFIGKSAG